MSLPVAAVEMETPASPRNQQPDEGSNKQQEPPAALQSTEYQLRKHLLLLATLVATVTYAAGLNLPGGAWQEDTPDGRHRAGDPILQFAHRSQYLAFYYCNATAFAASLVVSLLLLVLDGKNTGWWEPLLRVVMVLDLLGLMGAYAAGSCRDTLTTAYSAALVCAVFAYIALAYLAYLVFEFRWWWWHRDEETKVLPKKQREDSRTREEKLRQEQLLEELRKVLMLLATFAVTITYVAGLNPPGGFWGDSRDGHQMSDPVLLQHYTGRYQAFYVCNTTAFVASLLSIILLLDKKLMNAGNAVNKGYRYVALCVLIVTALLGLVGAYAAGSCREVEETIYVICLIGAVLAYIFLQVALTTAMERGKCGCCREGLDKISKFFAQLHNRTIGSGNKQEDADQEAQDLVMLLATLVASITYQAGLDPPGGLWPDDRAGHRTGDPILLTTHPTRYQVFFYSNSASFGASLVVIMMLQSRVMLQQHMLLSAMILDLFGLIVAYAAGSCRDETTSIYVVSLAGIVLVYVVIHIAFLTLDHKEIQPADADEKLKKRRDVLLLLAILAATLTYQAGLTPPGGFWQDNDTTGHRAGYPVLHDNYNARYNAFFYCNAASFMASVALIVLLVNPNLYMPGIRCYALYVCMVMGMFGLMGAYAAGSSRDLRTSIYVLTLVAAVFAFVCLEVVIFWIWPYLKRKWNKENGSSPGQVGSPGTTQSETRENKSTELTEKNLREYFGDKKENGSSGQTGSTGTTQSEGPENKHSDKNLREYLMLLGVLAASLTYQTGLKPPGGLWQDDSKDHYAGNPILHHFNEKRYHAFFYCNSTSFMASIVVIVLLLLGTLNQDRKQDLLLWPMHTAIVLDMLGLLGAYAAGSTRDWKTSKKVIYWVIIPILLYILGCLAWSIIKKKRSSQKGNPDEHKLPGNDEEGQK